MSKKRVIAVITFDDDEQDIEDLASAATWIHSSLSKEAPGLEVSTYSTGSEVAIDEAAGIADFKIDADPVPLSGAEPGASI